jgi:hypothetical protein
LFSFQKGVVGFSPLWSWPVDRRKRHHSEHSCTQTFISFVRCFTSKSSSSISSGKLKKQQQQQDNEEKKGKNPGDRKMLRDGYRKRKKKRAQPTVNQISNIREKYIYV